MVLAVSMPPSVALAAGDYQQVVDLTFPVGGTATYSDSYDAPRGGGTRVHRATDVMAAEGTPVHAAVGGTVKWITGLNEALPSYGYMIRIAGDDGRDYAYVHLGRQDGPASGAYAPGIVDGAVVRRGQLIGYVGCSGNASCDGPHLHFEIHDPTVTDPYGKQQINPYRSLIAAQERGDVPSVDTFVDIRSAAHRQAILAIAKAGIARGCQPRLFCPGTDLTRGQMATFIARALDAQPSGDAYFIDIAASRHEDAINALAAAGITSGCGGGRYCPSLPLTRGQMASLLAEAFELPNVGQDYFADDNGTVHEDAINRATAAGIASGFVDGSYRPSGQVSRQQMASLLARALGLLD